MAGTTGQAKETALEDVDELRLSAPFLGFGLFFAWQWAVFMSPIISSLRAPLTTGVTDTAALGTSTIALLLAAVAPLRLRPRVGYRLLLGAAFLCAPVGTLVIAQSPWQWLTILAWIVVGVGLACITWLWAMLFGTITVRSASLHLPASIVLGVLVYFLVLYMQSSAALVVTALLPIGSVAMFLAAFRRVSAHAALEAPPLSRPTYSSKMPWRFFICITMYAVAFAFLLSMSAPQGLQAFAIINPGAFLGTGLAGLLIAVIATVFWGKRTLSFVFRLTLPIMVAGFLLLPFLTASGRSSASAIVMTGFECFDILSWVALVGMAHHLGLPPARVFGLGRAFNLGGVAIGRFVGYVLLNNTSTNQTSLFIVISLGTAFALVATTVLLLYDQLPFGTEPAIADGSRAVAPQTVSGKESGSTGPWRRRCSHIAKRYGLSPREEEVLVLLAKGRDAEYIQRELFISNSTAKAHTYHIFKKLGIHSRQELIDMVERQKWE